MRILFAARAIDKMAGGVERMVITIMNSLVTRGHHVALFTWDRAAATAFYPMASDITWHRLSLGDPSKKANGLRILRRITAIRSIVRRERSQVVVCFQEGPFISLRLYALGLRIPFIAAERNAPTRFEHTRVGNWQRLVFASFRLARLVIIQCESYRKLYPEILHDRIVTIPNPVLPASLHARPNERAPNGRYMLLSVGRLGFQKNYDVLIAAFALLVQDFPDWDLSIVGDGEDREKLTRLVAAYDLSARVVLARTRERIEDSYASAHCFVLSSRWEGFPNALSEAMAHGLPAVGFADCAGVRDLIIPGHCGLLAEGNGDAASLARTLAVLLSNPDLRVTMGQAARARVREFAIEPIIDRWEEVLGRACHRGKVPDTVVTE